MRRTGARVVHAHNVNPTLGWRALAAAREAGARVVLHLHNYRLVCAVGTCFTRGEDCTRCHGRNTLPGVALNCRGGSIAESAAYAASLSLWQRPGSPPTSIASSSPARSRCGGCARSARPSTSAPRCCGPSNARLPTASRAAAGRHVLYVGRLSHEKGVADAIVACRQAGLPLVIAGDGPGRGRAARAGGWRRRPLHRPRRAPRSSPRCAATRPSRSSPRATRRSCPWRRSRRWPRDSPSSHRAAAASRSSCPLKACSRPADVDALGARTQRLWGDAAAGERALAVVRERTAPAVVARALAEAYG